MTLEEYAALNWFQQRCPTHLAAIWREQGRKWALIGYSERSEVCHALADFFSQPIWKQLVFARYGNRLVDDLKRIRASQEKPA